jgi:hypothetical protein
LIPAIHLSTSAFLKASSSASVLSYDRGGRRLWNGDELVFFVPPELYSTVMKLSSFVMSSQDAKLSSSMAELALLLAVVELAAIVVTTTQVIAVVVAVTKVIAVVVAVTKVDALVVAAN